MKNQFPGQIIEQFRTISGKFAICLPTYEEHKLSFHSEIAVGKLTLIVIMDRQKNK
jgi:hypothetical protein